MSEKVVRFSDRQKEKQEALRREYERFLFDRFLGCYTVIENRGLRSVEMIDISKAGCSFRIPYEEGAFQVGEAVDFRFYFSSKNYLPMSLLIQRVEKIEDHGHIYWQFGCRFDAELSTYVTLERFVEFIESFARTAKEDHGTGEGPVYFF